MTHEPREDPITAEEIAEVLRRARLDARLSRAEVALRCGYALEQYSQFERGERLERIVKFFSLLDVLGLSVRVRVDPTKRCGRH